MVEQYPDTMKSSIDIPELWANRHYMFVQMKNSNFIQDGFESFNKTKFPECSIVHTSCVWTSKYRLSSYQLGYCPSGVQVSMSSGVSPSWKYAETHNVSDRPRFTTNNWRSRRPTFDMPCKMIPNDYRKDQSYITILRTVPHNVSVYIVTIRSEFGFGAWRPIRRRFLTRPHKLDRLYIHH